jgi:hypothetical protein
MIFASCQSSLSGMLSQKVIFYGLPRMSLLGCLVNSSYQFDIGTGRNELQEPL